MRSIFILCFLIEAFNIVSGYDLCPAPCTCKLVGSETERVERLRVKCNKEIEDIKEININLVSVELYRLDISKNNIYVVEAGIFKNLTNLRRLDLSSNKITTLGEGSFSGLENLERLDLSKNQISSINPLAFRQLANLKKLDLSVNKLNTVAPTLFHDLLALERLKLNGNNLKTLSEGSFHGLKLLRQLDLSNNPWKCDCYIYWLSNWKNNSLFKLSPVPTCDSPPNLHGQLIIDLKLSEDFQCEWTSPIIEIQPVQNQVVFAGDSITLKCNAPSITDDKTAKLNWSWSPDLIIINSTDTQFVEPQNILSNIKIENRYLTDSGIIDSSLNIFPVKEEHNGQWNCLLVSIHGNKSKTISIIVISDDTKYCPLIITRNNKGVYAWPRTVIGWNVELPCEGIGLSTLSPIPLRASYQCNSTGNWVDLNTDACPFISPITKALEQYSKVNLSLTKGNLLETAIRFHNHTADPKKITDPIEIHFITKTVENYLNFLTDEKELGTMLIDIISSIMNLPKDMLKIAEINYKACTRLIKAVEIITEMTPSIQVHKLNFALEEFHIKRDNFFGLECTWYSNILSDTIDTRLLQCTTNNLTARSNNKNRAVEASIQLPPTLLKHFDGPTATHQLMISMYNDNSLFPLTNKDDTFRITSGIIGSKIIGVPPVDLNDDIIIVLKTPHDLKIESLPIPVIWNGKLNESGNWTTDGCHGLDYYVNKLVAFRCNRLGYYGLIEEINLFDGHINNRSGAKFHYSNPAIYIGTLVTIICLVCTSVTYIICYTSIVMPKRAKHSVINTWIAITLLCFLYTAGIHQTENEKLCEGIGLVLHYLSLCCLLWMAVSVSNMYKRLAKSDKTAVPDDEIQEPPIQKPILGLYLVGWGIALIICGISGAVNLHEYASYSYCFLSSGPALGALFMPVVILILYLTIFYLMVRCTIRSADVNGQLSEGTQATENMDLELLEPHENRAGDQNSIHSTQTVSSEVEDVEHSQITQLKGHIIILILYLMMWCSGAAVTAQPFSPNIPHEETIFAIIYAITASSLGLFVLLFYGIARSDVRSQWTLMRCWLRRKKNRCCRTRSVSDANPSIPAQPLVQNISSPISNSPGIQVISDTNSINSSRPTSVSRTCHTLKASDITSDTLPMTTHKNPNINLVVLHRQQYRSNNSVTTYTDATPSACVEMFYNPHQSGVARKFFKKQRRHTKNNNLGPRKQGDGGVTSDGGSCISIPRSAPRIVEEVDSIETSMFGSSAKVNNINIHVEKNPVNDAKNINILSDSGGSVSEDRNIPVRYVIGQEHLLRNTNKKVNNDLPRNELRRVAEVQATSTTMSPNESDFDVRTDEEKHLRNVSQQCSLEYSSELDSNQIMSERSDHNLPEIGETPETPEKMSDNDFRCSSLNEINHELNSTPPHNIERSSLHSSSLYCLSIDQYPPPPLRNSYRSSFNDVTSLGASSKICEADSRASMDDLQSEESSDRNSRLQRNSQRSLTDENSMTSDVTYTRDLPLFTGSLSNINRISINSCSSNNEQFQILDDLTLPNLIVDGDLINRPTNLPYLDKEFNSLTDLTSIDVTLGATRHLDMNASIGVDYEDTNYSNSDPYADDAALDDEVLLDSNSLKKETSV